MLIISGIVSCIVLANNFWRIAWLDSIIEKHNYTFTPLLRTLTGIWLWKSSNALQNTITMKVVS